MLNDLDVQSGPGGLRERAEAAVRHRMAAGHVAAASNELQQLLFELEVHKVELELQNEQLRATEVQLTHHRDRYWELYELAPVAYLVLDQLSYIREANLATAGMLGMERSRLLGLPLASLLDEGGADDLHRHLIQVFEGRAKSSCDLVLHVAGASREVRVRMESIAIQGQGSDEKQCRSVLFDVTTKAQVELPSGALSEGQRAAGATQSPAARRSVLLVEDEANARSALQELLRCEGYSVLAAATPSEALGLARDIETIDVLLADARLPEMSGEALAGKLRERHGTVQVILMSGLPSSDGDDWTHFIQKPIDIEELVDMIG